LCSRRTRSASPAKTDIIQHDPHFREVPKEDLVADLHDCNTTGIPNFVLSCVENRSRPFATGISRDGRYYASWHNLIAGTGLSHGCPFLRPRVSSDHLRRLSEGAQKGAPHAVAIGKTRLPGNDLDWVPTLLQHQPGGLDAQLLDRLCRRLAGLAAERTAELTRTQIRRVGELPNRQRLVQIALGVCQCALDTIGNLGISARRAGEVRLFENL
jgi:hypothetical protein